MSENNCSPIVDLSYLQEYTDGDEEMIAELIEAFQETASEGLGDFKKSIVHADLAIWKAAAHKLKGAAGYVGAVHLKALCKEAENMDSPTNSECSVFFEKIEHSYEKVHNFLENRAT